MTALGLEILAARNDHGRGGRDAQCHRVQGWYDTRRTDVGRRKSGQRVLGGFWSGTRNHPDASGLGKSSNVQDLHGLTFRRPDHGDARDNRVPQVGMRLHRLQRIPVQALRAVPEYKLIMLIGRCEE